MDSSSKNNYKTIGLATLGCLLLVIAIFGFFYLIDSTDEKVSEEPINKSVRVPKKAADLQRAPDSTPEGVRYSFDMDIYNKFMQIKDGKAKVDYLTEVEYLRYSPADLPSANLQSQRAEVDVELTNFFKSQPNYVNTLEHTIPRATTHAKVKGKPVYFFFGTMEHGIRRVTDKFPNSVVVNAANYMLLKGGGVDDAIHKMYDNLRKEKDDQTLFTYLDDAIAKIPLCGSLKCHTGGSVVTLGHPKKMCATKDITTSVFKYIMHTVGPVYDYNTKVMNLHKAALKLAYLTTFFAANYLLNSDYVVAPILSIGAFNFPLKEHAEVLQEVLVDYFKVVEAEGNGREKMPIVFAVFDSKPNFFTIYMDLFVAAAPAA